MRSQIFPPWEMKSFRRGGHGTSCHRSIQRCAHLFSCPAFVNSNPILRMLRLSTQVFWIRLLIPAVEARKVACVPRLSESGFAQVPVRADLGCHGAQVVPKVHDGRATPEPVAVINAVDHEPGLKYESMWDHRVVLGVGVLLDVEVLLNFPIRVGEETPLGANGRTELLKRVMLVRGYRGDLGVC